MKPEFVSTFYKNDAPAYAAGDNIRKIASYIDGFKLSARKIIYTLFEKYPNSILEASGKAVGLPEGQMGTSEVGHMNLGSGRVAMQPLENITSQIENGDILENEQILEVLNHVKENNSNLHLFGLLSDGGVHSHIDHLKALVKIFVHPI